MAYPLYNHMYRSKVVIFLFPLAFRIYTYDQSIWQPWCVHHVPAISVSMFLVKWAILVMYHHLLTPHLTQLGQNSSKSRDISNKYNNVIMYFLLSLSIHNNIMFVLNININMLWFMTIHYLWLEHIRFHFKYHSLQTFLK